MFLKEYWFGELYLGLKVTASFDRSESYTRVIDGQVRCITPEIKPQNLQVIWNVQFIFFCGRRPLPFGGWNIQFIVFVPAWMIPPVYHSLRRESIKNASSASATGPVCPPTWFEDLAVPKGPPPTSKRALLVSEGDRPFRQEFDHHYLKLWEDFLDRVLS